MRAVSAQVVRLLEPARAGTGGRATEVEMRIDQLRSAPVAPVPDPGVGHAGRSGKCLRE
ncbi:hypothetical protein AB0D71_18165 [Streptomyces avermitilis]|uniref:hypothetical protein n=1 Tax=Streptomyces avermitilis TaxID=33903 RepID=UPI0033F2EAD5